jgi:predicted transcriptional regulator
MSYKKTALDEEPFGIRSLERLDVGDLVQWSELSKDWKTQEKKIGIIAELYLEKRGSRNVALARINEIVKSKDNLSLLGQEREVLVVSLHILSKVSKENELLSV